MRKVSDAHSCLGTYLGSATKYVCVEFRYNSKFLCIDHWPTETQELCFFSLLLLLLFLSFFHAFSLCIREYLIDEYLGSHWQHISLESMRITNPGIDYDLCRKLASDLPTWLSSSRSCEPWIHGHLRASRGRFLAFGLRRQLVFQVAKHTRFVCWVTVR